MPSDSTSNSVVQLLAVAFRDAAEEHLAFTAGSVSHDCVQQFADQGIAILNDVDHRKVAAALATARRFVNRQPAPPLALYLWPILVVKEAACLGSIILHTKVSWEDFQH